MGHRQAACHVSGKETIFALEWFQYDTRRFFLFGIRLFFGLWLLYVGLTKWIFMGPDRFVGYITAEFDKTWSPHTLCHCQLAVLGTGTALRRTKRSGSEKRRSSRGPIGPSKTAISAP